VAGYPTNRISRSRERGAEAGTRGHRVFGISSLRAPRGRRRHARWVCVGTRIVCVWRTQWARGAHIQASTRPSNPGQVTGRSCGQELVNVTRNHRSAQVGRASAVPKHMRSALGGQKGSVTSIWLRCNSQRLHLKLQPRGLQVPRQSVSMRARPGSSNAWVQPSSTRRSGEYRQGP
jgi:hypothetical protein